MIHTLTIFRWKPTSVNKLMGNWRNAWRQKQLDAQIIGGEALSQGIPKAVGKRRVSVLVTVSGRGRTNDGDNFWKALLDSLVTAHLLRDDSPTWLELGSMQVERGTETTTVITLEDI